MGLRVRVSGLGLGSWFRVWGFGFGLRFGVSGLCEFRGLRVQYSASIVGHPKDKHW